ncbi:aminopeptidase [Granulicella sibirica]|uniref:Aminopeptidase S (Leu, Val, Phe, Tyr preference) n=1 Tax=Granulicella sibirica TaxID=2479048 RepID=A0A4Q0T1Q4_9BACT|nr:aminopeptidase [Granulicella sibirica]RXH57513.1 Aminopeptidase S (Leu, Val, Phe, Tyr preference) [Granulicella sibirica]
MSLPAILEQASATATLPSFESLTFEQKLDRFAEVAVRVGLNLAEGQELLISAPIEALPLVRRITDHAYKAGALLVTSFYADDPAVLARYQFAQDKSFDYAPTWLQEGIANAFRSGAARLAISGANPALLSGQDPGKIARANVAASKASKPAMEMITRHDINWSIVAYATPEWAKLAFPDAPVEIAVEKLWDAIFKASRITGADPCADWQEHTTFLKSRVDKLNQKHYHSLHFKGSGTDLHVGLADDHLWAGGGGPSGNGIFCNPNIPTEECFTTPHKDRVDGFARASKPLSHQGTLIKDIAVRFEKGKIVQASASAGEDALKRLIATDDGARRLGEVALVPHSSPIAQTGILFWNTLFDENAASHIALGQAYATCLIDGEKMDETTLAAKGANHSLIHVDWMIGSAEIDVDGVGADGTAEPLMRSGEWV